MPSSLNDLKRAYYSEALGLPNTGNMSITDLENRFFTGTSGSGGAYRFGFTAKRLPKWTAAVARVLDGGTDAKIMTLGDSQFFGVGSTLSGTFPATGSPMSRLSTLLNSSGVPSSFGLITPGVDNRWTLGSGWSATTFGIGILACYTTAPSANALTCTDARTTWDRCDVYVMRGSGIGTITATATGGSAVPINCNQAGQDITKITCSAASASSSNTISIVCSVANAYVVGVEFWSSTTAKVRVGNGGVGTTGAAQHVALPTSWGSIPFLAAYQADLVILGLGINDRGAGRSANQFKADMQTLVTAAKLNSDVIIASEMPAGVAPQSTGESDYNNVMAQMATDNNIPYYAYCERCQSFSAYNALGMAFDTLHQNNKGYWDWARGIVPALVNV